MEFHRKIKQNARASLRGCWGRATAIFFTITGVMLLISALEQVLYLVLGITGFQDVMGTPGFYLDDQLNVSLLAVACTGFSSLLLFLLSIPLSAGEAEWYFNLSAGTPMGFEGLFRPFSSPGRYLRILGVSLLMGVRSILWSVLFLAVPFGLACFFQWVSTLEVLPVSAMVIDLGTGASRVLFAIMLLLLLVFLQRYSLAFYLLAEKPQTSVFRILKLSVRMMKGHKREAFSLRLSFLGWALLSLLILPLLYVAPFYNASMAIYSRYVIECYQRAQMGSADPQTEFEPAEEVPMQPPETAQPEGDDGKTREYAFSDLQQQMDHTDQ